MNTAEAALVLAKAAAFDNRNPSQAMIAAWTDALHDIDYREALDAVTAHYRTPGSPWIMPGHIRALVAQQHRDAHARRQLDAADDLVTMPPGFRDMVQSEIANFAGRLGR